MENLCCYQSYHDDIRKRKTVYEGLKCSQNSPITVRSVNTATKMGSEFRNIMHTFQIGYLREKL